MDESFPFIETQSRWSLLEYYYYSLVHAFLLKYVCRCALDERPAAADCLSDRPAVYLLRHDYHFLENKKLTINVAIFIYVNYIIFCFYDVLNVLKIRRRVDALVQRYPTLFAAERGLAVCLSSRQLKYNYKK